jgi:sRNA-binding carbon storage regulator CsrA
MDVSVHRQEIYERIKKEEAGEPAPEQAPESGEPPTEET